MKLKIEVRGNTAGDIIDGLRESERRLKAEIFLRTGSKDYEIERLAPFEITDGDIHHSFVFRLSNTRP